MGLAEKLQAEKEKMEQEKENRGTGGDFLKVPWFKAEKGKNFLRIIENPVKDKNGDTMLWSEKTIHYGLPIKKKDGGMTTISVRCLRDFDEDCPMCNRYESMIDSGDKDGANKIKPGVKYFYNVLNYKNGKVEVLSAGSTIHGDIVQLTDLGCDFWDVKEGLDLKLVKEVEAGKPAMYGTSYKLGPAKVKVTAIPTKLLETVGTAIDLNLVYGDNLGDKMREAFGGTAPAKPKTDAKKEETESFYKEEKEEKTTKEASDDSTESGGYMPTDDMVDDDDLDKELASLGL